MRAETLTDNMADSPQLDQVLILAAILICGGSENTPTEKKNKNVHNTNDFLAQNSKKTFILVAIN